MDAETRDYFDEHFDAVVSQLSPTVHRLLDEVTLYVEDYPSPQVLQQTGATRRTLCGLYTGIPITEQRVEFSGVLSDAVYIYREGILQQAINHRGQINEAKLREQIRITVLHELGHHHGLDEDDLTELGYG
ncbi:metallopeptidase family protein [Lignipirellula cremea]|uniref:Possibl zinc metallo-peptidase n=1 Tax=Lignipirellula cremea TaxID=2528010 RepID=A0A518E2U2_9BACT|nr:metallopeptidase family protein [Lignipirellula cremea]QDU98405.1 Possibl zinc metallo-peptidase [Lignipirellula cremea]